MPEYWIEVYRDAFNGPGSDADVFSSESDMLEAVADGTDSGVHHAVLQVIRVPSENPPVAVAPDYLERLCREYLHDWEGERQHRESLRRVG